MSYQVLDLYGKDITARSRLQSASSETLREALEAHGLPVSGTKAQRAQRLVDIGITQERLDAEYGWRAREARLALRAMPYSKYDERVQREERDRFMRWQRSDWLQSVEDAIFQHEMLGVSAIHFSGDHRPTEQA